VACSIQNLLADRMHLKRVKGVCGNTGLMSGTAKLAFRLWLDPIVWRPTSLDLLRCV